MGRLNFIVKVVETDLSQSSGGFGVEVGVGVGARVVSCDDVLYSRESELSTLVVRVRGLR